MKKILNYLFDHRTLKRNEAEEVLTNIAKGIYSESEMAAFITVYLMRSITVDELTGFRDALRNMCLRINLDDFDTIDVCGTGGDGKDTFNISTLSVFVIAGAGAKVTKHGNYGVSSSCGSSNIMEYFGYRFSADANKLKNEISKTGVCFLHAPLFNPAMKNVAPVRKALKVKTFFNMLGPMVNPAFPKKQMVGVYSLDLARLYNYLYQQTDSRFTIVHSLDGYDEISLTGDFKYIINGVEEIASPFQFGYKTNNMIDLQSGSSIAESASIFMNVLNCTATEAQMNAVIANSQMALMCYYNGKSREDCKYLAEESLNSGRALESFNNLISMQ
jgi:anthranilate phosphoribosyltransferase